MIEESIQERLAGILPSAITGVVCETAGMSITAGGMPVPIGALVKIQRTADEPLMAEVVGFQGDETILFPLDHIRGVKRGDRVALYHTSRRVLVGPELLGRVIDARGQFLDGMGAVRMVHRCELDADPPPATSRPPIREVFHTGVRAIDGLLACGRGQRLGIFSAPGVGKSMSLGMLARNANSDVNVIALIGERGREVNEFLEDQMTEEVLRRSVVVVATSDQPALLRVQAAQLATAVAEYFRESGHDVMLLMDSLTRFATAAREVGLAAGETSAARGYPPSVFSMLPRLVERAGLTQQGSITAFYTVLTDGEDPQEPIAEAVRGYLDGHIVLSRKLAAAGHYPAIDVLESISRVMHSLVSEQQLKAAETILSILATYRENQELVLLGAYQPGSNPDLDRALHVKSAIDELLRQRASEKTSHGEMMDGLVRLLKYCESRKVMAKVA